MKSTARKDLAYYLRLKYAIHMVECEEGGYFARIPDLPGCMTQAETYGELMKNIREAKELWLEGALESGEDIPLPAGEGRYSGKLLVRMPVSLHARLARESDTEGVSLNQYVVAKLAEASGPFVCRDRPRKRRRR